jgi:hypothetical protein
MLASTSAKGTHDQQRQFDTARKLGNVGKHNVIQRGPRHHLKQLASRIGYLQGKVAAARAASHQSSLFIDEIDALFWLMAEYQLLRDMTSAGAHSSKRERQDRLGAVR